MTCVTRIAESATRGGLELLESFGDLPRLVRPGRGMFQIGFVMLNGGGSVLSEEGDFAEAPIDLVNRRQELLQRFVVALRGVALVALQLGNRAVQQRYLVVLNFSAQDQVVTLRDQGQGRVLLSTLLDYEGLIALGDIHLRGNEGLLIEV